MGLEQLLSNLEAAIVAIGVGVGLCSVVLLVVYEYEVNGVIYRSNCVRVGCASTDR
jgi:hypothetical protein